MQITRQQEIALWKLLADSFNLKDRGNELYRGDCPFCKMPRVFCINLSKNYSACLICGKGGDTFIKTLQALQNLNSSIAKK